MSNNPHSHSYQARVSGYREKALKMYPHICGRCGREFIGKRLRELTVHHRDHNHDNNPEDGSNWELLCLFCHDNEHQRQVDAHYATSDAGKGGAAKTTHKAFADLAKLMGKGE